MSESTAGSPPAPVWLPLRFRDLDAFGHVYHAEYLTLLDEARTQWYDGVLRLRDPESYVVAHLEIDYVSPLVRGDAAVRVDHVVERVGRASLTLAETMHARDGRAVARVRTVTVLRDAGTGATRPLDGDERARVEALVR